jgi:Flp pilus assembly protein TadD
LRPLLAISFLSLAGCASHTKTAVVQPTTPEAMQRQVRNAVDAGDGDYQTRTLRAKLDANPRDTAARLELAAHYQKAGFPDIAIEHCRLACERDPESAEAHLALAKLLRHQNQTAEAAKELAAFANHHQDNIEIWAWLGLLQDETSDWKSGEASHRKAIALAPTRDDLHNNLGYCLLQQNRKPEAAIEFREALKLNPQSTFARNNLGIALASEPKEAILNWQSVSTPADAHSNMAAVLIEAGQYTEARSEINLALSYNQQHSAALSNLRLVSQLDGKAAEINLPARTSKRFSRARKAWHRFWSGSDANGDTTRNSGTPVASR